MHRYTHISLILCIVTIGATASRLKTDTETLTIDQAVALAHQNREILEAFKQNIDAKKMLSYEALSGYLPSMYGNAKATIAQHKKSVENALSIEGKQLLYSPAGPIEYYNVAKQDTVIAKHLLNLNYDLVRYNVETAFLKSWLIQQRRAYIDSLTSMAEHDLSFEQARYDARMSDRQTLRSSHVSYARHRFDIDSYDNELMLEQRILQRFVGKTLFADEEHPDIESYKLTWAPPSRMKLKPISAYYELARTNRKDLAIKESEIKRDSLLKNLHLKKYLPSAYLVGGLSAVKPHGSSTDPDSCSRTFDRHIGLRVEWQFFDGLSGYFRSRGARARALRSTMEKLDLFGDIKMRIQTVYYRLKSTLTEVEYLTKELKHCLQELANAHRNCAIGIEATSILPKKKNITCQARFAWIESRVRVALLERELAYICGYPITIDS